VPIAEGCWRGQPSELCAATFNDLWEDAVIPEPEPPNSAPARQQGPASTHPKTGADTRLLAKLASTVQPFFSQYVEMEKSKLALEEKVLGHEAAQSRRAFWGAVGLGGITLVFSGLLFMRGSDDAGMKLISAVAAIAGAAFGGYGLGLRRRRTGKDGE
jgi:hypothetical protein